MGTFKNLSNKQFGRLTVLRENGRNNQGKIMWLCRCECGKLKTIYGYSLTRPHKSTKSCGCLQRETASKLLKIYRRWGM